MTSSEKAICSLDVNERELGWLQAGMEMVLDGLRDQRDGEVAGTREYDSAREAVEQAEALRGRIQFWAEGGESA